MRFLTKTFASIWSNRELVWEMALRDLKGLNKGAVLGVVWLILGPLIQVGAYVIIVSFVFQARSGGRETGHFDYVLYVLSGMVPWQVITKSIQESPSLIRERMELVKQVIYPIETLPMTSLISSSVGALVSFVVFLALSAVSGKITWTYILLPVPLGLLVALVLGTSWVFSIAGVLLKDLREVVTVILGLMVYVSPVVIEESMVNPQLWQLILWNPLAHVVICFRDVLVGDFHGTSWLVFAVLSGVSCLLGGWVVTRAKILINEYI